MCASKTHVIYRYPKGDYECFVEWYCFTVPKKESTIFNRQKIHGEAQTDLEGFIQEHKEKLQEFFSTRKNEGPFVESAGKSIDEMSCNCPKKRPRPGFLNCIIRMVKPPARKLIQSARRQVQ